MKKIIPLLVVSILVLGGLGAVAIPDSEKENIDANIVNFSKPIIVEKGEFVTIALAESNADLWETDKPLLPLVSKVYTYPFGTIINDVQITFSNPTEIEITKKIEPSPEPQMKSAVYKNQISEKEVSYQGIDIYPEEKFGYRTGAGLLGKEHVIYLSVGISPVQYKPNENKLIYHEIAEISIDYTLPAEPVIFGDEFDLLIITPAQFSSTLQRLVEHKDSIGIKTKLSTLEEIPSGVGLDQQEDIKYYIKDAIESWGITYVLLIGAGVEGSELFPVRKAYIPSNPYEDSFASDLYYADIYNSTGGFSNWDYDGDGKHAEYPTDIPNVDVLPDVYLGKLPVNNIAELNIVIDKIIYYKEHNKMTNKIVQIGGDTFPGDNEGIYEGEFANEKVLERLPGYTSTKLWGSNGKLTKRNIAKGFRSNVDFVDFSGHGSQYSWATHPPNDDEIWIPAKTLRSFYTGWLFIDIDLFLVNNKKKYPVVFYNACSTSKYPAIENCLSWVTLAKKNGGGIAVFGATGIGYGAHGSQETARLFGWMEVNTHEELLNTKVLGDVWGNSITGYYTTFSANLKDGDYKTMLEYSMFGDPTVIIEDGDDPVNIPLYRPSVIEQLLDNFPLIAKFFEKIFG
jgi:hypothetical protein